LSFGLAFDIDDLFFFFCLSRPIFEDVQVFFSEVVVQGVYFESHDQQKPPLRSCGMEEANF
jgi:hypothetical protein